MVTAERARELVVLCGVVMGVVVGTPSGALASWTAFGPGAVSTRAVTVGAGNAPSVDVDGSSVALTWAASTMSNGAPVAGYIVRRYDATGTVQQPIVSGTCASVVAATSCAETHVADGIWTYSVTPVQHEWRGAQSPQTTGSVDTLAPSAAVTFPAPGSSHNAARYAEGCGTPSTGDLCGTAGAEATAVQVSIRRNSTGDHWDGTGFTSADEVLLDTTGTAYWSYGLAAAGFPGDGAYTVRVHATDAVDQVGTASSTFTIDGTAPPAPDITTRPAAQSSSTNATFGFTDFEPSVTFECRLDGAVYAACTSPRTYSGLANTSHTFDVRAVDAAGNRGAAASYSWSIDTVAPSATLTFPPAGTSYNATTWNQGCESASDGDFCGTSSDAGSGVASVRVSMKRAAGGYWDGSGFNSATPVPLTPSGTTRWSYGFAAGNFPADGSYSVLVNVTDAAGNDATTSSTFTVDRTAPAAQDVQTTNAGTNGSPELGDSIAFTYTEAIAPGSVLPGWTGSSTNVVVRISDGGLGNDVLTVWNFANTTATNLGTVDLGRSDYVSGNVAFGASGTPSTMVRNVSAITVTLGTPNGGLLPSAALGNGQVTWTPATSATDPAGNAVSATPAGETGIADRDF